MVHGVRGIPLAQKASTYVGLERELPVEHLHREPLLISMRRRVNDGHSADSQDGVDAVLAAQRGPHAALCALIEIGRIHRIAGLRVYHRSFPASMDTRTARRCGDDVVLRSGLGSGRSHAGSSGPRAQSIGRIAASSPPGFEMSI